MDMSREILLQSSGYVNYSMLTYTFGIEKSRTLLLGSIHQRLHPKFYITCIPLSKSHVHYHSLKKNKSVQNINHIEKVQGLLNHCQWR